MWLRVNYDANSSQKLAANSRRLLDKTKFRRRRKDAALGSIAVKKLEPGKVGAIQGVIDVAGEIFPNHCWFQIQLSRPGSRNFGNMLQSMIARLLENSGDI